MYIEEAEQAHIEETSASLSEHKLAILNAVNESLTALQAIRDQVTDNIFYKSTRKGKDVLKVKKENRKMLFDAYRIIQQIRETITGEVLKYHLYVTLPDGRLEGIELGDEKLEHFLSFEGTEIRIAQNKVRAALNNVDNIVTVADKIISSSQKQELYSAIMKRTELATHSKGQFLLKDESGSDWMKKRSGKDAGRSNTVFNKGHIVEGIDTTMSYIETTYSEEEAAVLQIDDYVKLFYQYIRQDTISGFAGGDNPFANAQVKANHAQLMAYSTIISAMDTLLALRSALASGNAEAIGKAKDAIHGLYVASGADAKIDQNVDKFLDDFISEFGFH